MFHWTKFVWIWPVSGVYVCEEEGIFYRSVWTEMKSYEMLHKTSFGNSLWTNYGTLNAAAYEQIVCSHTQTHFFLPLTYREFVGKWNEINVWTDSAAQWAGIPSTVSMLKRSCYSFLLFLVKPSFTDFHWEIIFMCTPHTHTHLSSFANISRWSLAFVHVDFLAVPLRSRHPLRFASHENFQVRIKCVR